jgi:hypothetical protein
MRIFIQKKKESKKETMKQSTQKKPTPPQETNISRDNGLPRQE